MKLLKVFLVSLIFLIFAGTSPVVAGGSAAHYSAGYTVGWWERTMYLHAEWGNAVEGWQVDPNGFYCVRPGMLIGERLWLRNADGVVVSCTIGDSVQVAHQALWWSRWVVEVNWDLYIYLGLDHHNYVEVYTSPLRPAEWYFEETEHSVSGAIWRYWDRFGDFDTSVALFGYPLDEATLDPGTGLLTQRFERAVLEMTSNGVVRGQRVGDAVCQADEAEILLPETQIAIKGRLFPETGYSVSGNFLAFWERLGDSKVSIETFGYPVSSQIREEGGLLVQCFERAIFEQHPDGVVLLKRVVAEQF